MSRIKAARRRSAVAKKTLAGVAAASLVVAGVLARATNPGHAARATRSGEGSSSTSSDTQSSTQSQSSDDFSVSPSPSQPKVETSVS